MHRAIFFSEGRVDAVLLESEGRFAFIDAGYRSNGLHCVKRLRALGVERLDWYMASHAHKNHVGGAGTIIRAFSPGIVYVPHARAAPAIIKYAAAGAERRAAEAVPYQILRPGAPGITLGALRFEVWGPVLVRRCLAGALAENDNSLIVHAIAPGGDSLLLTGDTSASILAGIEKLKPGVLRSTVLKNPHHNGALPASMLSLIAPQTVVVCNSARPSASYRRRIAAHGAILRTACTKARGGEGSVVVLLN